ncbi:hypothetical protein [Ensifer adhaerens]|uniref:hypothetical protein n=1 Tax=Ensifer adhaerens TaxID=106592 RepID=UPI001F30A7A7|nr:hypothetical protein [Ensifer adhaerens]
MLAEIALCHLDVLERSLFRHDRVPGLPERCFHVFAHAAFPRVIELSEIVHERLHRLAAHLRCLDLVGDGKGVEKSFRRNEVPYLSQFHFVTPCWKGHLERTADPANVARNVLRQHKFNPVFPPEKLLQVLPHQIEAVHREPGEVLVELLCEKVVAEIPISGLSCLGRLDPAEEHEDPDIVRRISLPRYHISGKALFEDIDVRKGLDEPLPGLFQIIDPEDIEKIVVGDIDAGYRPRAARSQKIPFDTFRLEVPQSVFPSP